MLKKKSHVVVRKKEEDIDQFRLCASMLQRALDDFAMLDPKKSERNRQWFEDAKNWLFGENKKLTGFGDSKVNNFTIQDVCDFFHGDVEKVRNAALFMRRFKMNSSKFTKIYFSNIEDEEEDYNEY